MRRRLDLAGALVASPSVLFLDEPTTGLDPRSRNDMWDVIRELVHGGTTVLLTTQYLEEADRLADEIVVIDFGRVIAKGTADQLKAEVGGERIEIVVSDVGDLVAARQVLFSLATGEVLVEQHVPPHRTGRGRRQGPRRGARPPGRRGRRGARRRAAPAHPRRRLPQPDRLGSRRRPGRGRRMSAVLEALADGAVVAKRNLIKVKRVPELLLFTTIQPIMFILLFAYVFGSAIDLAGIDYREFLIAGIFAQTVVFGATFTGAGIADDMQKGILDRFRSLPMSRSAVLLGRTASDIVLNILTITVMSLTGLLVGWRIRTSVLEALAGFLLLLLFAYAISWIMAYVGLLVPTPEVVQNASFVLLFPATFIASTFVPTDDFPSVLRTIANWNPVSTLTQASRELFGNTSPLMHPADVWSMQHPVLYTLLWVVGILAVFVPLATWQYKRAARR